MLKDPIFALFSEHLRKTEAAGAGDGRPYGGAARAPGATSGRRELIARVNDEMRAQSAWTVFFHTVVAHTLGLNTTDHRCLDLIWQAEGIGKGDQLTPGRLAHLTQLTSGAITGILDRLEQAGYIRREHDPEDRRRVIIRAVTEKIEHDLHPLFDWLTEASAEMCDKYSDDELELIIGFAHESQQLLEKAIMRLKTTHNASPGHEEDC
ncbi:MAG TPA: MarR family transcriptional regulator [Dehalococcoidia bacterium]|nr:MarR family transcriptional regulator [Dehalococcoidia bacterium]